MDADQAEGLFSLQAVGEAVVLLHEKGMCANPVTQLRMGFPFGAEKTALHERFRGGNPCCRRQLLRNGGFELILRARLLKTSARQPVRNDDETR